MRMSVTEQYKAANVEIDRINRLLDQERTKRFAAENKLEELNNEIRSSNRAVEEARLNSEHWRAQLFRSQGFIDGMNQTLLALGLIEPVKGEIRYDNKDNYKKDEPWRFP